MRLAASPPTRLRLGLALGLGALLAAACTNDFDQFDFEAGAGGGATVASTASAGGAGGVGGVGGAGPATTTSVGGGPECTSPLMCPGGDTDCRARSCTNGTCGVVVDPAGSPCNDAGGSVCDDQGECVQCIDASHCVGITDGACGAMGTCLPPSCTDGLVNDQETAVDCGGPTCDGCANLQPCLLARDCASNLCVGNACSACVDDVDCAGVTDTWCDGGVCTPRKAAGTACGGANECQSGFCPVDDGVCCDAACGATCASCLMAHTGQADGVCAAVLAGGDPDGDCTLNPALCTGDNCSGVAGVCEAGAMGQTCRGAADVCDAPEVCDGATVGCPADAKLGVTTICRLAAGTCDAAEVCDGVNDACPADAKLSGTTTCRPVAGACDLAEVCDGVLDDCPLDLVIADGGVSTGGTCGDYLCDGTVATCPTSCVGNADCTSPAVCTAANVCQ